MLKKKTFILPQIKQKTQKLNRRCYAFKMFYLFCAVSFQVLKLRICSLEYSVSKLFLKP